MPLQLLGLLLAFVCVLFLISRRVSIALCVLTGTAVIALTSRLSVRAIATSLWVYITRRDTFDLVLGVAVITMLAGVMKRFGLLQSLIDAATGLLGGARPAIVAIPSIIGTLPVQGGAILSAPIVDRLGDELKLSPVDKAAVNMVFRHAWFYVAPFAPQVVLAAGLAGLSVGSLVAYQLPLCLVMLASGYVGLLSRRRGSARPGGVDAGETRGGAAAGAAAGNATAAEGETAGETAATNETPGRATGEAPGRTAGEATATAGGTTAAAGEAPGRAVSARSSKGRLLWQFVRSALPLLVGVLLAMGAGGLSLPLYVSIGAGLVVALFLARREPGFGFLGLSAAWRSINWPIVLAMASILVFGQFITDSGTAEALVTWLTGSGLPLWAAMLLLPAALGIVTGIPEIALGIAFPLFMPMVAPGRELQAATVMYAATFLPYYISPVHLCQALTTQFFGVTALNLYRRSWFVLVSLVAASLVYTWIFVA